MKQLMYNGVENIFSQNSQTFLIESLKKRQNSWTGLPSYREATQCLLYYLYFWFSLWQKAFKIFYFYKKKTSAFQFYQFIMVPEMNIILLF
jgi:hypothetical protein